MKKLALLLALLLAIACPASAQTREGVILLEGEEEPIVETFCDPGLGYTFWYDADVFAVAEDVESPGLVLDAAEEEIDLRVEILRPENMDVSTWKFLEMHADPDSEYLYSEAEDGSAVTWFTSGRGGLLMCYFAVEGDDASLVATAAFPMDAAEGFLPRLRRLFESISFVKPLLTAAWGDDAEIPVGCVILPGSGDEYEVPVLLRAGETITDVRILKLEFQDVDDEGHVIFAEEEVRALAKIAPEAPVLLWLSFPGDIATSGVSFMDGEGVTHRMALEESGLDGSLVLWEY